MLCDTEMQSTSTPMSSSDQGPKVTHPSTFSKDFYSETTGPISFKFHIQSSGKGGKKYVFDQGHMIN